VRAGYLPRPWDIAQRARAADLDRLLDDLERRLSRFSSMLPAVASAPKVDRVSDTIASALNEIADRFTSRARTVSRDAGRMGERMTADAFAFSDEALRKVAREVEQRPLVTLAIAVGIGALAAGLLARR
jgi:ElaB/YqjD/DUF883 family membrane-anchored ribosome-binding protein